MLQNDYSKEENSDFIDIERRFVSYISSLLHYNSINFDKKNRKYSDRFSLILEEVAEYNLINSEDSFYIDHSFEQLEYQIGDPTLHAAFMILTERERTILNLIICSALNDTEIAQKLSVSQQCISKAKNNGLRKLRKAMSQGGEDFYG